MHGLRGASAHASRAEVERERGREGDARDVVTETGEQELECRGSLGGWLVAAVEEEPREPHERRGTGRAGWGSLRRLPCSGFVISADLSESPGHVIGTASRDRRCGAGTTVVLPRYGGSSPETMALTNAWSPPGPRFASGPCCTRLYKTPRCSPDLLARRPPSWGAREVNGYRLAPRGRGGEGPFYSFSSPTFSFLGSWASNTSSNTK